MPRRILVFIAKPALRQHGNPGLKEFSDPVA
jgi:hypothetical protein